MSAAVAIQRIWAGEVVREKQFRPAPPPPPVIPVGFYRSHTKALLLRYMQLSMEMGRTPSALNNCMFRGRVSSYRIRSFEDAVIFVLDVESCLKRLDPFSQALLARVAMQEHTQDGAADLLGLSVRSVSRKYPEALDRLSTIFLSVGLLSVAPPSACQERCWRKS